MLTSMAKYFRSIEAKNGQEVVDIAGKEGELAKHVSDMSKLFFDEDVKVMLDRQSKEFEKFPEKRVAIWRYRKHRF